MDMTDDDLNAPLGQFPVRKRPPLGKLSYIGLAFGGLGLLGGIGAFFPPGGLAIPEPHAGIEFAAPGTAPRETAPRETLASLKRATPPRPVAEFSNEASVPLPSPLVPSPLVPSAPGPRPQVIDQTAGLGAEAEAMERRSGVKIIRPGGGATPGALIIDVAAALNTRLAAAPDPRLIEQTRHGPVPRIGFDGARPAEIYARPAVFVPGLPRIALLVGGMGLSPRATEAAIAGLPGAVTLGFAPYGADLARQTALAREAGHELVLEIPMEPFDFPRDNPGPHTLVADAGKAGNGGNLTWLMSRFTGYAGVANFLGGKFTADAKALTPVLREFAARGLFFVDDGTSARSLAMTLASGQDLTAARADIVIDSTAETGAIEAALARLEAIARDKGLAIGVASALPASVESIGRFARALEARGIALVPLSSAMPRLQRGVAEQQP
jgi:polysaccharide deacetylase 2 family uncharacterized protein YibQ